jgi:hypothetical protein
MQSNTGLNNPSGFVRPGGALLGQERDHSHFRQHVLGHASPRTVRQRLARALDSDIFDFFGGFFIDSVHEIVAICTGFGVPVLRVFSLRIRTSPCQHFFLMSYDDLFQPFGF